MDVKAIIKLALAGDTAGAAAALKALLSKSKSELKEEGTKFVTASILEADEADEDESDEDDNKDPDPDADPDAKKD